MCVELYGHNIEPYNKIIDSIKAGNKRVAVSHATGTGKTYLISKLFEDYSDEKKLVLVPLNYIKKNMFETFEEYSIKNADIMLYQSLINKTPEELASMNYQKIVLDEFHHATSDVWGDRVNTLINAHPDSVVFGTSATPVRTDGVDAIEELFDGNCVSELSMAQAIVEKILPIPKYIAGTLFVDARLKEIQDKAEKSGWTSEEKKEFAKTIAHMRSHIEESYGMATILGEHIKNKDGKYLVFCKDKVHLEKMRKVVLEWFKTAGFNNINDYAVYSDYSDKDTDFENFQKDTSDNLKLLFCINMLNEGLHLNDISGAILLRTTSSHIIFRQQIGRVLAASNKYTPVIIDAVSNSAFIGDGIDLLKEIKDAIQDRKNKGLNFDDSSLKSIATFFITGHVQDVINILSNLEGCILNNWMCWYQKLLKYSDISDIKKNNNPQLYAWIIRQRQAYKMTVGCEKKYDLLPLTEEQISLLKQAGVQLEINDDRWDKMLKQAEMYYKKTGKFRAEQGSKLSHWENKQVSQYNKNLLSEHKKEKLLSIGFVFDIREYNENKKFDRDFELLKKYYETNGHYSVSHDNVKVRIIINEIRHKYRNNELSKQQIDSLKTINFQFSPRDDKWEIGFSHLCSFQKETNLTTPKKRYRCEDGFALGFWISNQRKKYVQGKMPMCQIERLKGIGVTL